MTAFRVVLDACVLVPIHNADLLLTFAERRMFVPMWSDRILDETARALPRVTKGSVTPVRARLRIDKMNAAFEDALITGWESLEAGIEGMPDPDDRHVVAAAVRGRAEAIVTDNVRDFPAAALEPLGLQALSLDRFLLDLMSRHPVSAAACVAEAAGKRTKPPMSTEEYVGSLSGVPEFVQVMRRLLATTD